MIRVELPYHLRNLAGVGRVVEVDLSASAPEEKTIRAVIDAIEARYPALRGTVRDLNSGERRPFIRFFACGRDLSLDPLDAPLPAEVVEGKELLRIVGAMAGG